MKCPNCGMTIQGHYRSGATGVCSNCGAEFRVKGMGGGSESEGLLSIIFMFFIAYFPIFMVMFMVRELMLKHIPAWGAAVSKLAVSLGIGDKLLFGKTVAERMPLIVALLGSVIVYVIIRILAKASRKNPSPAWIPFRVVEFLYVAVSYFYLGAFVGNIAWVGVSLAFSGKERIPVPEWVPGFLTYLFERLKGPPWIPVAFTVFMILCMALAIWFAWTKWSSDRRREARS